MQVKLKKCRECSTEFKPFKTTDKYCSFECADANKKPSAKKVYPAKKKQKRIKPFSDKKLNDLAIYRPLRDKYLGDNPTCEVHDCNRATTNLHHKNGRTGKLLYDTEYFMACCHVCHPQRIHENPEWARENGYLI